MKQATEAQLTKYNHKSTFIQMVAAPMNILEQAFFYTNNSEVEIDSVRFPDYGTVFQGEMLAIKVAAKRCY